MFIYHDETGSLLYTSNGKKPPPGDHIAVPDGTEVDLLRDKVVDGELVKVAPTVAELLEEERAAMTCEPLQGILALGETMWSQVEAMAADPETPFPMRISILRTVLWVRNSQMMDELAWIMGLTDEQVDDLFRVAMQIVI